MSDSIELKYPIPLIEKNGERKEIKFLKAGRLKVKHFELIPSSLMDKVGDDGAEIKIGGKELLPLFKELIPFLAGIFNLPVESVKEIDYDDIENVMGVLESIFPKDEKKN